MKKRNLTQPRKIFRGKEKQKLVDVRKDLMDIGLTIDKKMSGLIMEFERPKKSNNIKTAALVKCIQHYNQEFEKGVYWEELLPSKGMKTIKEQVSS